MPERKPLGPVGRWMARAPQYLYRWHLGWALGSRFTLLEHTGRTSGLPRSTVLEVVKHDSDAVYVAAAWGPRSDWFRNILCHPAVRVSTGRRQSRPARASVLAQDEAAGVFASYAEKHRLAASALARSFDLPLGDPTVMAAKVPIVRLVFTTGP